MMNLSKFTLILSFLSLATNTPTALANDDCVDAVVIAADSSTLPFQTTGDVTSATADVEWAAGARRRKHPRFRERDEGVRRQADIDAAGKGRIAFTTT